MDKRKELEKLSIYELRAKGRSVGVKAVTTKKQNVIIDEIIKIENGELAPVKNKMGRPPKNILIAGDINDLLEEKTLIDEMYDNEEENYNEVKLESPCFHEDEKAFAYKGVLREQDGKKFIKNYGLGPQFVLLPNQFQNNIKTGDVVVGNAFSFKANYGLAKTYNLYEYSPKTIQNSNKAKVVECKDIDSMYSYVVSDNSTNKIISEVETRNGLMAKRLDGKDVLAINTRECSDIIVSYNMLLDVKNIVKNLSSKDICFSLYLVDVEYMYSILSVYFESKNSNADLNAGQYFKELLSAVLDSKYGKVVIFEKENNKRSSYLDIILNRYCSY